MKIVFLAPFGIRPKGTVIARMLPLAVELQALGHEVVIVAPPYTNPEDSGKAEVVRGVMLRNVRLFPGNKVLGALVLCRRLLAAALSEKPDLIHLFKPKGYAGLAGMLLSLLRALGRRLPPLFLDSDDWEGRGGMNDLAPYSGAEKRLFAFQERLLPGCSTGVSVASRTLQSQMWGGGVDPERVLYLPNCVEEAPRGNGQAVRSLLGIAPQAPVLLLYTRFFEFDQEKLYQIFSGVHARVPGVRFLVVGKGRKGEEQRLWDRGRELGFQEALVLAGWVEPELLPDYLAAGDLAIYPFADTLVNRAKCPAKLTELLNAGVPVVADRVGQITEYVGPGAGVLCDPDDWAEMAQAAAGLLLDPLARRELGEAGRRYLLQRFRWKEFAEKLDLFYKKRMG